MPDNTSKEPVYGTGELRKIGNYLGLREEIDPQHKVTNLIRANLSVVDIIPVNYAINFAYVAKKAGSKEFAISYDFTTAMEDYYSRCNQYGLKPYNGLQLWLTDDTQAYEEFTNTFDSNLIETKLNSVGELGQTLQSVQRSVGLEEFMNGLVSNVKDATGNGARGIFNALGVKNDTIGDMAGNLFDLGANLIIQGKQISLPKIWRQSDYNPSLTFSVKLVSPYGDPKSIRHFIIEPLIYILLLAAPESTDGLTYGLYQPVKIKSYGISNINLGAIQSVSLRRGGRESSYNVFKQPLQIEVGITCIPLSPGFAYMNGVADIATIDNSEQPYEENASGSPAFTTVGNIIQSLRPAPTSVTESSISGAISTLIPTQNAQNVPNKDTYNNVVGSLKETLGNKFSLSNPESTETPTPPQNIGGH